MRWILSGALAFSVLLAGILVGGSPSAAAPKAAPTPVPRTMPNFGPMSLFMGTWHCTTMLRGRLRPDTSTTTVGLGGAYMVTHDVAPPFDPYRRFAVITDNYMTWNPHTRQWVTLSVDNTGGYGVGATPGWRGNTITTTSQMTNDGSHGSDTLTRISSTKTIDRATSTDPQGHTTHTVSTCTKLH